MILKRVSYEAKKVSRIFFIVAKEIFVFFSHKPWNSWILIFGIASYSAMPVQQTSSLSRSSKRLAVLQRHCLRSAALHSKSQLEANPTSRHNFNTQEMTQPLHEAQKNNTQHLVHNGKVLDDNNFGRFQIQNAQLHFAVAPGKHYVSGQEKTSLVVTQIPLLESTAHHSPLVVSQQLSHDLHQFSQAKAQQHEQRLQESYHQKLNEKLNVLYYIGENIERIGFSPHSATLTTWCKSITLEEWRAITNGKLAQTVINAPYLLQYDAYRTMVKAAPQYAKWVAEAYLAMQTDKAYDAEWRKIPHKTRDYIYSEGQHYYTRLETDRLQKQLHNKTSLLYQDRNQLDTIIQRSQQQSVLLAQSGTVFEHELQGNAVASKAFQMVQAQKEKNKNQITFVDYYKHVYKAVDAATMQTLEDLGITKADFVLVGSLEQQLLSKNLFIDEGYVKIASLATSDKVPSQHEDAFTHSLKNALTQARAGIQAIRNGDMHQIELHFSIMHDLIGYAQQIESGAFKEQAAYSAAQAHAAKDNYWKRHAQSAAGVEVDFAYSPCFHACVKNCQNVEQHTHLRENNEDGRYCYSLATALGQIAEGQSAVTYNSYSLPHITQQALQDAGLSNIPFKQCLGTVYDHEFQSHACDLAIKASTMSDHYSIQRAASLEAAYDSIVAHRSGNIAQAQVILDAGYELSYMKNNAVHGQQASLSPEATIRYMAKAVELCCDFGVGVGKGVVASALRTVNLAAHPTELVKEIGGAIKTIGALSSEVVQAAADIAYVHIPGISQQDKKVVAQRILERQATYMQFAEQVVATIQNMSAQDAGEFVGSFAFDTLTGKAVAGTVAGLLRRTKGLWEVVKKSEKIAEMKDALSQRYKTVLQQVSTVEERVKSAIDIADQPQTVAAGAPGNVGVELMETGQKVGGAGKQIAKVGSYVMEKFVSASKTTEELTLKYGNEIKGIIESYADKCRATGLPVPDMDTFQHVISGHMTGGSRLLRPNGKLRSVFNAGEDWVKLGIEAWEKGTIINPGIKEYDFGRIIGKSLETGEQISKVKIVTRPGEWVTIFPLEKI